MDGNKDEAERCRNLACKAFEEGLIDKAKLLILKAERMYTCDENKELLKKFEDYNKNTQNTSSSTSSSSSSSDSRSPSTSNARTSSQNATEEQHLICQKVLQSEDFYEVLAIQRNADEVTIRKAYKKLAFQLHPDKNKAPRAEEAFKKVSECFQCLIDPQKRSFYDQHGHQDNIHSSVRSETNPDFVSAEQLFNLLFNNDAHPRMTFGRSFVHHRPHFRGYRYTDHHHHHNNNNNSRSSYIQFIPIILFILFSLIARLLQPSDKIQFSYQPTVLYSSAIISSPHNITYYVKTTTKYDIFNDPLMKKEMDLIVEIDYFEKACKREQDQARLKLMQAKFNSDREKIARLSAATLESCNTWKLLKKQNPYQKVMA